MSDDPVLCQNCREAPTGPGGVLCPDCLILVKEHADDPYGEWFEQARTSSG